MNITNPANPSAQAGGWNPRPAAVPGSGAAGAASPATHNAAGESSRMDAGDLGADQVHVSAGAQAAGPWPDGGIRADRVAEVRGALAAGSYAVDARAVAGSLIGHMAGR
jgi:anti-sigma28 factor (negative regulator of flagellin synthesis)